MQKKFMTVEEIATLLRVKERTILEYLRNGKMQGVNIGSNGSGTRWRIPEESVEQFIADRMNSAR